MRDLYTELQSEPATTDSQAMWDKFTSRLQQGIDKHIPTRSSGTKDGFPGVTGQNFPPVSFFPGERMGRPILSPGKK